VSHFTTLRTQITDTDALVAALADMGYDEVEVHDEAQPLIGYLGDTRRQRAHVIVRRRHVGRVSNDIGFERQADGHFTAVISDYDRPRHGEAWLARLTARHAYHAAATTLAAQGFDLVDEQTDRDGTVRLVLRRVV
jgi:hypothetical protein